MEEKTTKKSDENPQNEDIKVGSCFQTQIDYRTHYYKQRKHDVLHLVAKRGYIDFTINNFHKNTLINSQYELEEISSDVFDDILNLIIKDLIFNME